jgi:molecular chaperone DnaK (HSP70)
VRLGIDFGTTRTVVACADRGNYPVLSFADDAGDAVDWFPSVVAENKGELKFGLDALALGGDPAWTIARSFKRLLGDAGATPDSTIAIGGSEHAILDVVAGFLEALRTAVLTRSNLPKKKAKDTEMVAVVATPANALGAQRFLTLDAFRRAGFDVIAMLNEPSAAGFEYTHRYRNTLNGKREHVVVYDLGGGTFDASLVRMSGTTHEAVTTAGLHRLGGDDFDAVLVRLVLAAAKVEAASLDARSLSSLADACRDAKERLAANSKRIVVDHEATGEVTVETKAFYDACAPLIDQTLEAMAPVIARLEDQIAGIYVVGGASSLPAVGRALRDRFGRRVHASPYPSAATAVGLAIASDRDAAFELTDRFSRNLGVFREATHGHAITFDPIFVRDTELPARGAEPVVLSRTYRAAHNVGHFRFVECASLDGSGAPQGTITPAADVLFPFAVELRGDAPLNLGEVEIRRLHDAGPVVREEYVLDAHGLVELRITDVESGYTRGYRLAGAPTSSLR